MPSHHQFQLSLPLLEALLFYLVTLASILSACFNHIPFFNHLKRLCFSTTKQHIIPLPGTPHCIFRSRVYIFIPELRGDTDLHIQHLLFQQFSIVTTETSSENAAPQFLRVPQRAEKRPEECLHGLQQNSDLRTKFGPDNYICTSSGVTGWETCTKFNSETSENISHLYSIRA